MDIEGSLTEDFRLSVEESWASIYESHRYSKIHKFSYMFTRFFLKFCSYFCLVDLYRMDKSSSKNGRSFRKKNQEVQFLSTLTRKTMAQKVFTITFYFCTGYMCWVIVLSYRYDLFWYEYKWYMELSRRLISKSNHPEQEVKNVEQRLEELRVKVDHAEELVSYFGSPFLNLNFMNESTVILIIFVNFVSYQMSLLMNYRRPYDMLSIRFMLQPQLYLDYYSRLVICEINDYIESSRNFVRICLSNNQGFTSRQEISTIDNPNKFNNNLLLRETKLLNSSSGLKAIRNHNSTVRLIRTMALNGKLIPLNRTSHFTDKILLRSTLFNMMMPLGFTIFAMIFTAIMYFIRDINLKLMDLIAGIIFTNLCFVALVSMCFYVSLITTNSLDYVTYVIELRKVIESCIYKSRLRLDYLMFREQRRKQLNEIGMERNQIGCLVCDDLNRKLKVNEAQFAQLNEQLVYILLQYRFLVRQLKTNKHSVDFFAFCALMVITGATLIIVMQAPYVDKDLVLVSTCAFMFFVFIGDCCLVPICYRHSKCLDLCRSLFSLLAHLVELERNISIPERNNNNNNNNKRSLGKPGTKIIEPDNTIANLWPIEESSELFDMHILRLIWKELSQTDILTNKFATISVGLSFTYPNFMRFHILSGFLIVYSALNNISQLKPKKPPLQAH